jgi:hypothetical protein
VHDDELVAQALVLGVRPIRRFGMTLARANETRKKRSGPFAVRTCFFALGHH